MATVSLESSGSVLGGEKMECPGWLPQGDMTLGQIRLIGVLEIGSSVAMVEISLVVISPSLLSSLLCTLMAGWKALPIVHSQLALPIIERKQAGQSRLTRSIVTGGMDAERRLGCIADK